MSLNGINPKFISEDMTTDTELSTKLDKTDDILYSLNEIKVKKNPGTGEFLSIVDALASIIDNSTINRYVIKISPGEYTETPITMKPYVSIIGASSSAVFIKASTATDTIITMVQGSGLDNVTLTGASGVGGKAVYSSGTSANPAFVRNCQFGENETLVECSASSGNATIFVTGCISGQQNFTYGFKATNTSTGVARILLDNHSNNILAGQAPIYIGYTSGATSGITVSKCIFRVFPITGRDGFIVEDGAELRFNVSTLRGFDKAFSLPNTGTAPKLYAQGGWVTDSLTYDLLVEHPTAVGIFEGNIEVSKSVIPDTSSFFIRNKDLKKILVSKKGGDYASISAAITSITDSDSTNPYIISVGPGIFTEVNPLIVPINVSIVGSDINSTVISPADPDEHLFEMTNMSSLNFMTLQGVAGSIGSGKAAIHAEDVGDFAQFHKLSIYDFDIGIYNHATTTESVMYVEYVDINGDFSFAVKNHSVSSNLADMHLENFYTYPSGGTNPVHVHSEGLGAELMINSSGITGGSDNVGVEICNGGLLSLSDVIFNDFLGTNGKAILNSNIGSGSVMYITSTQLADNTVDVSILNPASSISMNITANANKVNIATGVDASAVISDNNDNGIVTLGEVRQGPSLSSLTPIGTLTSQTGMSGVYEGGTISAGTGLAIVVSAGKGFCYDVTDAYIAHVTWTTTTLSSLTANTNYWISVDSTGTVAAETSNPGLINKVYLTRIRTGSSSILWIGAGLMKSKHYGNLIEGFARNIGPIYLSGSIVTENGTRGLDVSSGKYQLGTILVTPSGGTAVSWSNVIKDGSGSYTYTPSISQVDNTNYDNGSGTPVAMTTDYYRKDALYTSSSGASEELFLVRGQVEFSSQVNAEGGNIPTPPDWFTGTICLIATVIVQKSATNLVQIRSERPILGFQPSGVAASSNHTNLSGLSADDHPQYLLVNGTRAMTNNLDMGTHNITNVGTVDGVDVSAHASRHLPNGTDPLTTGAPSTIGSANSTGTANALARQDHVHSHGDQTAPSHHAIATVSNNGFMSSSDKTKLDGVEAGATAYTDEKAQDAVGSVLLDSANIDFTYNDATPSITADLTNTTVVPGSYTNSNITVDQKGRVTAVSNGIGAVNSTSVTTAPQATTLNTMSNITELVSPSLDVGLYRVHITGHFQSSANNNGAGFQLAPGTATISFYNVDWEVQQGGNGTDQDYEYKQMAANPNANSASNPSANSNTRFNGWGIIRISVAGTIQVEFRSELSGSATTVQPDTIMRIESL